MKLDEFKKLEELRLSSLLGDYGAAAVKKMTGQAGGKSVQQQMAQDMFLKDFVGDAVSSLETAIEGGLVDPNIKSSGGAGGAAPEKPVDPASVTPEPAAGAPAAPTAPTAQGAPAATAAPAAGGLQKTGTNMATGKYKQQQQSTQNLNNYVKGISQQLGQVQDKAQKVALTKELVNFMADRKDYPEWGNALKTAEFVLKKNSDPNFATAAIQKLRAGQRMDLNPAGLKEGWKIYYLNMLIEGAGLTWKDLGLSVLQESRTRKYRIVETRYLRLNKIFESIVEADASGKMSIGEYLKTRWYPQYMKGVNYSPNQQAVDSSIDAIEASYSKDKGKAALEKLAQMSYALSKGNVPAGAANIANQGAAGGSTAAPGTAATNATASQSQSQTQAATSTASAAQGGQMNSHQMAELVKNTMAKLKSVDAKLYAETLKELTSGTPTQGLDAKAPSAAPAEKPGFVDRPATAAEPEKKVAESKTKIRRFR
jgi:hypothetical protein